MKTVKQIADELGVSKQAVHQKMKQEPLSSSLRQFMSIKGNTLYIEVDGESLIKQAFEREPLSNSVNRSSVDVNKTSVDVNQSSVVVNQTTITETLIDMLKLEIEFKNRQLEVKDIQISELQHTVNTQQETIKDLVTNLNAAQALHAGTIQQQLVDNITVEKEATRLDEKEVTQPDEKPRHWWQFWK